MKTKRTQTPKRTDATLLFQRFSLAGIALAASTGTMQASGDYGPAIWRPACSGKWYTSGNGHKFAVIHDMEGYYWSSMSYLNQCGVQASIHYCVNGKKDAASDPSAGEVSQCVSEAYYAWHANCWNTHSWGTEHEGFVSNPAWFTDALYNASADLQRHLADKAGFAKDRNHVIGHDQKRISGWPSYASANLGIDPNCNTHSDPGSFWDWTTFMGLIRNDVRPRIDVFVRGGGNNLYQKFWDNGTWSSGFSNKGGSLAGDPTCVSWGPDRLDIFARGTDGSLQHLYWNSSSWSSWENLGGGFVGNPDACSWGPNRLDVFARNSAGNLIHKWYSGSGNWSGWEDLSGPIASDPAATSWGPGRIDVFARGLGNTLKHVYYTGSGNWSWEDKGGSLVGSPDACSYTSGRLDVFCRNSANSCMQIYYGSGGWSSWVDLGGTLYSDPGCASHADRRINIFCRGGDDSLFQKYFDGSDWSGWFSMGGVLTSGPDACSWSNTAGTR
jgi:hypothetical protein